MEMEKCLSEIEKLEKYSGNHQKENHSYAWDWFGGISPRLRLLSAFWLAKNTPESHGGVGVVVLQLRPHPQTGRLGLLGHRTTDGETDPQRDTGREDALDVCEESR